MRRGIGDSANFLKLRNNKPVVKSKSLIPRRVLTNRSCFAKEQKPVSMCVKLGSFVVARTYRLLPKALEVCVDNVESALNAFNGGAKRIELCSALNLGGLTPSVGLLKTIKKLLPPNFIIFVMIRPKPGEDYVYDEHDIEVMTEDIKILKANGADGFVFGCLDKERYIDVEACRKLLMVAEKFPCTFHRAFDVLKNPEESLEIIINLGFSRVLTSGQEKTAYLGRNLIKKLVLKVKELGSDIIIVAGGGIDLNNLREILSVTQVKEYHGSAKTGSLENYDKEKVVFITNESIVRKMIEISKNVF